MRWLLLLVLFFVVGCGTSLLRPLVTEHPAPPLAVDFSPFEAMGCHAKSENYYECPPESELGAYCHFIQRPDEMLGGLEPSFPMAQCEYFLDIHAVEAPNDYLFRTGGLLPFVSRYVILVDGEIEIMGSLDALQMRYAPITSDNEALSYAIAATNLFAKFDLEENEGYAFEQLQLEETHVVAEEGKWVVNLFGYDLFGCGPHYFYSHEVTVFPDGQFTTGERVNLFRDPNNDNLCVD